MRGDGRGTPTGPRRRARGAAPGLAVQWYADTYGTTDGYLLRNPRDITLAMPHHIINGQWQRLKNSGQVDIPDGMVLYGLRHFFASNCLGNGIPITDVAEWMGHRDVKITFKHYRHLMPGSISRAAEVLDLGLAS